MRFRRGKLVAIMTAATMAAALTACSGRGSDDAEAGSGGGDIVIRASYPLSGPLASAGASVAGIQAYFDAVNADGGVNGHKIDFKASDDAFDPARMVSNNKEFVQKDKAAIVLNFGGISLAARPVVNDAGVAQIVQGGEGDLSDVDGFPYTRAFVPDITWEGELQGRYIKENYPDATVGFMGFNNDFSDSQLAGLAAAGVKPVKALRLPPGQGDVTSQVTEMKAAGVDVLVVTLGPPTMGALMKYMGQISYQPTTFIGSAYADFSSTVNPAGAENVEGALSYQWFKDPQNPEVASDAGIEQFRADMAKYAPDGDATSTFTFTGYGLAAAIVSALQESDDITSDGFLKTWDALSNVQNPLVIKEAALTAEADGRLVHQYQLNEFDGTGWVPQGDVVNVAEEGIAK